MAINSIKSIAKECVCFALATPYEFIGTPKKHVVILGYHSISHDNTHIDVTPENFISQINYLKKKNYDFITLKEAYSYTLGRKKITKPSVAFTFDDGYEDLIINTAPLLEKLGIPATYFVISHPNKVNRKLLENNKPLFSKKSIAKMVKFKGTDIQGHTTAHKKLFESPGEDIELDLKKSKKKLESVLSSKIHFFAYPWGIYTKQYVNALVKSGYKAAFTTKPGILTKRQNPYLLPRVMVDKTHSLSQFRFMLTPLYPPVYNLLIGRHSPQSLASERKVRTA
ncbi:MAG: polysaccharide deacetylase family protein [Microgenomates group bacterium]